MRIFKDFRFEAAHRLPCVPGGHKCKGLHGHNYRVRVEVAGELTQVGWVQDFAIIQVAADVVLGPLDHRYLNEVPGLDNPTAENIAQYVLDRLRMTAIGSQVSSVTVWETEDCGAIAE